MKKLLLLCFIGNTSFAATDSLKLQTSVAMQGNYTFGNYNNYSLGLRADLKLLKKYNNLELTTIGKFSKEKLNTPNFFLREKEAYSILSYSYSKNNRKIIFFTENEYSYLRKINWLGSVGIGYGYKFLNKDKKVIEISEAILPERINFDHTNSNGINLTSLRLSTRIKLSYDKYPFTFSNISLIQPAIWNSESVGWSDNMIIRSATTLSWYVWKKVQIGIVNDFVLNTFQVNVLRLNNKKSYDNAINFIVKTNF